jgi:hypothetical protein
MYLGETAFGLWIGGVAPALVDNLEGYVYNVVMTDASTACYYIDNVASFP